jgi:hypothetical protein
MMTLFSLALIFAAALPVLAFLYAAALFCNYLIETRDEDSK